MGIGIALFYDQINILAEDVTFCSLLFFLIFFLQLFKQGCPFGNAGILGGPVSKKKKKKKKKLHLLNIKTTSIKY